MTTNNVFDLEIGSLYLFTPTDHEDGVGRRCFFRTYEDYGLVSRSKDSLELVYLCKDQADKSTTSSYVMYKFLYPEENICILITDHMLNFWYSYKKLA